MATTNKAPYATRTSRTQVQNLSDFRGGLNLVADSFKLAPNESPDMLNVDIDVRGGFLLRRGTALYSSTTLGATPSNLWSYGAIGSTERVYAHVGSNILFGTGATWTTYALGGTPDAPARMASLRNTHYVSLGSALSPRVWNTGTLTYDTLTSSAAGAWQEDLLTPTGTHMPRAKTIASHAGYMWAGGVTYDGSTRGCRLHFSHPTQAQSWRSLDYIEVEPGKLGDSITALVPAGDHLLVFKNDSMYAITGYDTDSFSVITVSNDLGTISQESVVSTPSGVYFFDKTQGLFRYTGIGKIEYVFGNIWPALRDGDIPRQDLANVMVGYVDSRVWVSVPWTNSALARDRTFIYDPQVQKGGAWMVNDLPSGPFAASQTGWYSGMAGQNYVVKLEQDDLATDSINGSGAVGYESYYRTRWVDIGQPAQKKRWRRLEAVLQEYSYYEIPVEVFVDYDPSLVKKTFKLQTPPATAGTEGVWDTSNWDAANWASPTALGAVIDRGSTLGLARAVSLKIGGSIVERGTTTPTKWGVDSLAFKYIPRKVR